ncbi:MAG: ORF6N domain-containing protein, partial [Bacteroidaceae bacterium]|nr:ORF6N domain-containing protein [Bacteroidaceae bacterium]
MKSNIVTYESVQEQVLQLRGENVLLDYAVAQLYGVETREINQAVRNNPDKFPKWYVLTSNNKELADLRSKFLITNELSPKTRAVPKAFTEKGLYMLATILKSKKATQTTIAIIEAFAKLRELGRTIGEMAKGTDEQQQKTLMKKSGEIVEDLFGEALSTSETETE